MTNLVLLLAALAAGASPKPAPPPAPASAATLGLRDGDLVFQESRSSQAAAVAAATGSRRTHMGVVLLDAGRPLVLEAVEPVRLTPFDAWRARGAGGRVEIRRLREADRILVPSMLARLQALGRSWVGRSYDTTFRWDDDRLYCSELAWKRYDRVTGIQLGRLQKAGDLQLGNPAVRALLKARFGQAGAARFDPAETVVTPQAIFEDPRLISISAG